MSAKMQYYQIWFWIDDYPYFFSYHFYICDRRTIAIGEQNEGKQITNFKIELWRYIIYLLFDMILVYLKSNTLYAHSSVLAIHRIILSIVRLRCCENVLFRQAQKSVVTLSLRYSNIHFLKLEKKRRQYLVNLFGQWWNFSIEIHILLC